MAHHEKSEVPALYVEEAEAASSQGWIRLGVPALRKWRDWVLKRKGEEGKVLGTWVLDQIRRKEGANVMELGRGCADLLAWRTSRAIHSLLAVRIAERLKEAKLEVAC